MFGLGIGTPTIGTSNFSQFAAGTPGQAGMFPGFPGYSQYGFGSPGLGYSGIDRPGFISPRFGSWPSQEQQYGTFGYGQGQYGFGGQVGVPNYFGLGSAQLGMPHYFNSPNHLNYPNYPNYPNYYFNTPNYPSYYGVGRPEQWGQQYFGMPDYYHGFGQPELSNQFGFDTRYSGQWQPWAPYGHGSPNYQELSPWAPHVPYKQVVRALVPTPFGFRMLDVVK